MGGGLPYIRWGDRALVALVSLTVAIGVVFLLRSLSANALPAMWQRLLVALIVYLVTGLGSLWGINRWRDAVIEERDGFQRWL